MHYCRAPSRRTLRSTSCCQGPTWRRLPWHSRPRRLPHKLPMKPFVSGTFHLHQGINGRWGSFILDALDADDKSDNIPRRSHCDSVSTAVVQLPVDVIAFLYESYNFKDSILVVRALLKLIYASLACRCHRSRHHARIRTIVRGVPFASRSSELRSPQLPWLEGRP